MHFGLLSIFQNYCDTQSDAEIMQGELALARLAERTGFDSYWATEHHFFGYSMCPDNFQWLAQVGASKTGSTPSGSPRNPPPRPPCSALS